MMENQKLQPLLSIVIPVFNAESYLEECIKRLCEQTYKNLEFVFVNDGSNDDSLQILDKYRKLDSRILIINQENLGATAARLKGLNASKGKYVAFLDSDDFIEPETYTIAMNALLESNAELCVFNYDYNGKIQGNWRNDIIEKEDIFRVYFEGGIHNKLWNKVFSREVLSNVDFPIGRDIREDAYIMPQILLNCKLVKRIPDVLYHYRVTPTSLTHKKSYTDQEKAGCYRNDYEKIKILWDQLPEERGKISEQFIQLFERVLFEHIDVTYFDLGNSLMGFASNHFEELNINCTDPFSQYLLELIVNNENFKDLYKKYFLACIRPGITFSIYKSIRIIKHLILHDKGI